MEGLGAAASALAVVSVSDQIAERVKQLHDFWSAVVEAPQNIRAISTDLGLLSNILEQISNSSQRDGSGYWTVDVLNGCKEQVHELIRITTSLEIGFSSSSRRVRKWSAVKAVFKEARIAIFRKNLEALKTTLVLAQQESIR